MKYFFGSGVSQEGGGDIAVEAVRRKIKDMIAAEDKSHPLSDAKLGGMLQSLGIKVARRTVAKYREQMGIGSSSYRKRVG